MAQPNGQVTIPYAPRRAFLPYHNRPQRWSVIVAHRRCGKTVACINDLIKAAITCDKPDGRYAYIAPLFNQAKDVAWSYLKKYAEPLLASKPNETELRVDLVNGSRIRLYGADNPDRLRGIYLDGVVLDEYADMPPSVWSEVLRPLLADRRGWATFIGTPKGRNQFWEVFDGAAIDPDWFTLKLRASETNILDADELEAARKTMTPEHYEQEFECSFEAAIIGAYFGKELAELERRGRLCRVEHNPLLPTHTAWDLGIGDSTAIWFFQVAHDGIRVIDYYENHGQPLGHYASVRHSRPYGRGTDYVPHDARVRSLDTGRTRIEAMVQLGLKPVVIRQQKLEDSIQAARITIPNCWFDEVACRQGIEALRQYRTEYDEKTRAFKNTPKHDWTSHGADAFRYLAQAWRELKPTPEQAPPKVKGYRNNSLGMTLDQMWKQQESRKERTRI